MIIVGVLGQNEIFHACLYYFILLFSLITNDFKYKEKLYYSSTNFNFHSFLQKKTSRCQLTRETKLEILEKKENNLKFSARPAEEYHVKI